MLRFNHPRVGGFISTILLAAALAAPGTALGAATVSVPETCYVSWPDQLTQSIPISAHGLQPGASVKVELRIKGQTISGLPSLTVDGAGNLVTELKSWTTALPNGPSRPADARIVISDLLLGTELAVTDLQVANVGLEIDSSVQSFATKRRWRVSGLSRLGGGTTYWAHYFKGTKEVARTKLGPATGACGYLLTKKVLIPVAKPGRYVVSVQAARTYSATLPAMSYKLRNYK